jgi:hypothetical protein
VNVRVGLGSCGVVRVGDGVRVKVGEALRVCVGDGLRVGDMALVFVRLGEAVGVPVAGEGVAEARGVVRTGVAEAAGSVRVRVNVGESTGEGVREVGEAEAVAVAIGELVGVRVALGEWVAVEGTVGV